MSEMALTAQPQGAAAGDGRGRRARRPGGAWTLHDNPTKFLSTVQIGITSIGVLNGIVGEAAFSRAAGALAARDAATIEPARGRASPPPRWWWSIITFLTIIFGELVPKRLGQMYPETVARLVARPMDWLSTGDPALRLAAVGLHRGHAAAAGHPRRARRAA